MIFLTTEQLEGQGISPKTINTASQIQCSNKLLNRGPEFTPEQRQAAINFVRKCLRDDIFCLIQENQSSLVVWTESQDISLIPETRNFSEIK